MRQQYGFSAPVLQTSFRGETRGGSGRVGRFFRLEENTQQNRRPAGNHIEVQLTRTNSSVFLNGSREDLTATFVFCFVLFYVCTIISALESKVSLLFELITSAHH